MSITVSNCQYCDDQQFRTLSWVYYTIFLVVNLDVFIRARAVIKSESCYGKKLRVRLAYILLLFFFSSTSAWQFLEIVDNK